MGDEGLNQISAGVFEGVRMSHLQVLGFKIIRNRSLSSSFACRSLWPVSLPRWAQIEIQGEENADGKTHPSLDLLAGNREFGYTILEDPKCSKPEMCLLL